MLNGRLPTILACCIGNSHWYSVLAFALLPFHRKAFYQLRMNKTVILPDEENSKKLMYFEHLMAVTEPIYRHEKCDKEIIYSLKAIDCERAKCLDILKKIEIFRNFFNETLTIGAIIYCRNDVTLHIVNILTEAVNFVNRILYYVRHQITFTKL